MVVNWVLPALLKSVCVSRVWSNTYFVIIYKEAYGGETSAHTPANTVYHFYLPKGHNNCAFQIVSLSLKLYVYQSIFSVN